MISLLISLLILAIILYVVILIVGMLPLPEPVKQIAWIIVGLVFLLLLLRQAGVWVQ